MYVHKYVSMLCHSDFRPFATPTTSRFMTACKILNMSLCRCTHGFNQRTERATGGPSASDANKRSKRAAMAGAEQACIISIEPASLPIDRQGISAAAGTS